MKRTRMALIAAACLAAGPSSAGEEQAIVRLIEAASRAMSELPKSRDRPSVLKFYAADYRGLTDGEWQTRENLESVVAEIEENVRLGNPVQIENRASNVQAEATGNLGWAVYDFYSKIEVLGEVLGEVKRRCTGIYRKTDAAWKIRHENCSTTWAAPPTVDEGEEELREDAPGEAPL